MNSTGFSGAFKSKILAHLGKLLFVMSTTLKILFVMKLFVNAVVKIGDKTNTVPDRE